MGVVKVVTISMNCAYGELCLLVTKKCWKLFGVAGECGINVFKRRDTTLPIRKSLFSCCHRACSLHCNAVCIRDVKSRVLSNEYVIKPMLCDVYLTCI